MKLTSKPIFTAGITLLVFSGISIILNHQGFALRLIIYAYWILCLAAVHYLWEIIKGK